MDILLQMVSLMNRKEVKNFNIYLHKGWEKTNRKDVALFDYLRKNGTAYNDEKAFARLYNGIDKNAFYRLKNRLAEDINLSLFEQEYRNNDMMYCHFLMAMANYYAGKDSYKLALYNLKKAEKKAQTLENYSLLDMIYTQLIQASREVIKENPERYIQRRRENRNLLNKMGEVDDILEVFEYKMMISQNFSNTNENILNLLHETVDNYTEDVELKNSSRLQFGIYLIVSRMLLQKKDFPALQEYLISAYSSFCEKRLFVKANHTQKLQMLSWLVNVLFMNKKYVQSLEYAEILKTEMEKYDAMLFNRFEFFYYNSLVINFSVINPAKAIDILLDLSAKEKMDKFTFNGVFVFANLAVLYYGRKDYGKALQSLNKLYNYDGYQNTDPRLKLKINLGELMMRYENKEYEILAYRLKQVYKDFEEMISNDPDIWEAGFLNLFSQIIQVEKQRDFTLIKETAHKLIDKIRHASTQDDMLFAYDNWIAEKARID